MVDEYKDKVKRLTLTETINSLLEIQGTDLSEFLDHNQISNLLIDCRDEILRLTTCLRNANENFEHFEREWYLANDRVEILEKQNSKLKEMFRVHMLRLLTNLTHEDIDNHIEEVLLNDQKNMD
jgi:hypothetical protein